MSKQEIDYSNRRNSISRGFILVLLGAFFLLRNMNLDIPEWVISWQMIVIVIGLMIGIMSNFKNAAGPVTIFIGGIFLARDIFNWSYDVSRYTWPIAMIVAGLYFIFRRESYKSAHYKKEYKDKKDQYHAFAYSTVSDDFLDISAIFSGVNRIIVSKGFKGGTVNAIFGGCDLNLTQADFTGTIEIEANCIFGGAEIVVPANWEVKVLMNTIFGGVEDKRPVDLMTNNPEKTLIIKGSCIFGGIEIKSYK
jgi:predicted membrane protein